MVPYIGNGSYCYANATAMLLASVGEAITPAQIEVLTGVGMGAIWLPKTQTLFFGNGLPDIGISNALAILGFACTEEVSRDDDAMPRDALLAALQHGSVVLGPLDMSALDYNPIHEQLIGADHFVLAYAGDEAGIALHDPAGFPCVALSFAQLDRAWKAAAITYHRGAYRCWHTPRRERQPTPAAIYAQAMIAFRNLYQEAAAAISDDFVPGSAAIRTVAAHLRDGTPSPAIVASLIYFALPVSARRALDYAAFFAPYNEQLATLKTQHATLFGRAQTQATHQAWPALADTFATIADVEDQIRTTICS